jgi:hypothetical protein
VKHHPSTISQGECTKASCHRKRQRCTVRALTRTSSRSSAACVGGRSHHNTVTRITTGLTYTFRPENQNEGGVVLLRQPSVSTERRMRHKWTSCALFDR